MQAPDGGKEAHQCAVADITVHPAAHLPKDFGTERHIVLEKQARHIITAALYTLAAHERHWDPTTIPAMPPPPQGPKDSVIPFRPDQLLSRRATPHLHPSRIELAIASWDTLDTPPRTTRHPHPQSGRPMGGFPLGTGNRPRRSPKGANSDSSRPPPSQAAKAPPGKPSTQHSTGLKAPPTAQTHRNPRRPGSCTPRP